MAKRPTIEEIDRWRRAMDLRRAGYSYEQIAEAIPFYVDRSHAYKDIQRALKFAVRESADEVLSLELERLDQALRVAMASMLKGNLQAIDKVLRIMDRRAKYLGLDAPTKVELPQIPEGAVDGFIATPEGALLMAQIEAFVAEQGVGDSNAAD